MKPYVARVLVLLCDMNNWWSHVHVLSLCPKQDDDSRRSTMIGLYSYKDMDDLDGDGDWTGGPKELIPPVDQVVLTEKELKEEFTRVLNAKNPHAPPNIVQFYHKDRVFKQVACSFQHACMYL